MYEIDINKNHFHHNHNRAIFIILDYIISKEDIENIELDPLTILSIAEKHEKVKKALKKTLGNKKEDSINYIKTLSKISEQINPDNINIHIKELIKANAVKDILNRDKKFKNDIEDKYGEYSLDEIINKKEKDILTVSNLYFVTKNNPEENKKKITDRYKKRKYIPNGFVGYPTPFNNLNVFSQGLLRKGSTTVVNAKTNVGKSLILKQIATCLAINKNIPIYLGATEQEIQEQEDRIITELTGIPIGILENGLYNCPKKEFEWGNNKYNTKKMKNRVLEATEKIKESPLYIDRMEKYSPEKLVKRARYFKTRYDIKGFIWDYVKVAAGTDSQQKLRHYLGHTVNTLKEDIAIPLQIFTLTASQAKPHNVFAPQESNQIKDYSTGFISLRELTSKEIQKNPLSGQYGITVVKHRQGKKHKNPENEWIPLELDEKYLKFKEV